MKWRAISRALAYDVRILSPEGDVVWEARSEEDHVAIPIEARLADGRYFVIVHTTFPSGAEVESAPVAFTFKSGS